MATPIAAAAAIRPDSINSDRYGRILQIRCRRMAYAAFTPVGLS